MRRRLSVVPILLVLAIAAAGCGKDEAPSDAASVVPAGSVIYGEATLAPEGDQRRAVEALIEKFPGEGTAGERVQGLIQKAFAESASHLSFEKDVEPWLGDEAALFFTEFDGDEPQGAAVFASEDDDAARDAIEKEAAGKAKAHSYKGEEYTLFPGDTAAGVVDGWFVLGDVPGFEAVVDTVSGGRSISDDDAYAKAIADAGDDRLGLLYFDGARLLEQAGTRSFGPLGAKLAQAFRAPYVATLHADENGARLEADLPESLTSTIPALGRAPEGTADVPADSWFALGLADFSRLLDYYVDLYAGVASGRDAIAQELYRQTGLDLDRDLLGWMGEMTFFLRGTKLSELDGALTIETTDERASGRLIRRFGALVDRFAEDGTTVGRLTAPGGGEGVTLHSPQASRPIHIFQREGRVVIAFGDAAARDAIDAPKRLGDTPEFEQARASLGGDYDVSFYVAMPRVLEFTDSTERGDDADWLRTKPYLEPLGALIGGNRAQGEDLRTAIGAWVP